MSVTNADGDKDVSTSEKYECRQIPEAAATGDPEEVRWMMIVPDDPKFSKVPEWVCSAAMAADGTIYAPAALAGSENKIFFLIAWDGVSRLMDDGHLYVPVRWLAAQFPDLAYTFEGIEHRVREHFNFKENHK